MADAKTAAPTNEPVKPVVADAVKLDAPKVAATQAAAPTAKTETVANGKPPAPTQAKSVARVSKAKRKAKPAARKTPAIKAATIKKIAKPVRTGIRQLNQGAMTMTKIETPFVGTEQFKNTFGDVNERAKVAMEKTAKIAEEIADLTRGNVEALVASSKVAAKGVETMSQDAAEYSRKSFEDASAALKSFAEVKSPTDFFKLQSDFARSAFDSAVAESARVSEAMIKIAGDVAQPITSRYTVAAERVKTLAA